MCSLVSEFYTFYLILEDMSTNLREIFFSCYIWHLWRRVTGSFLCCHQLQYLIIKENRIYIRREFTRKKCKTAILLYCFHTAGVLHIFVLYNLLGPGISFYRKSKINVKRKPNYEIGWFHNWPMIISHWLYAFQFTNDDFPL